MKTPHHKIYDRWIHLSDQEQDDWVRNARNKFIHKGRIGQPRQLTPKTQATIDGTHIKTLNAFFCAMGEAAGGPRGYFGLHLQAFHDCCFGGFGLVRGFHLIWKNHHISKQHLDSKMLVERINEALKFKHEFDEDGMKVLLQHKKKAEDGYTAYEEILDTLKSANATIEER